MLPCDSDYVQVKRPATRIPRLSVFGRSVYCSLGLACWVSVDSLVFEIVDIIWIYYVYFTLPVTWGLSVFFNPRRKTRVLYLSLKCRSVCGSILTRLRNTNYFIILFLRYKWLVFIYYLFIYCYNIIYHLLFIL